jgi:hypothetical protein
MNLQPSLSVSFNDRRDLFSEELKFGGHGQRYLNGAGTYLPSTYEHIFYEIDFLTDSVVSSAVFRNINDAESNLYDGTINTNTTVLKGTTWDAPLASITLVSGTAIAYQYKKFIPENLMSSAINPATNVWYNAVIAAGGAGEWGSTAASRASNKISLDTLVKSLKDAGLWINYKYRVLAGTNTLAGGLNSGIGGTVSNVNFVAGDIDPLTGWIGDGSTKYLSTNWVGNSTSQDDFSVWCWVTSIGGDNQAFFGNESGAVAGGIQLTRQTPNFQVRTKHATGIAGPTAAVAGLVAISRNNGATSILRAGGSDTTITQASDGNSANVLHYFARAGAIPTSARISAFGVGPSMSPSQMTRLSDALATYHAQIVA